MHRLERLPGCQAADTRTESPTLTLPATCTEQLSAVRPPRPTSTARLDPKKGEVPYCRL